MLIILDRDGVINLDSKAYIKSPDEWIPIPGSIEAIARLCQFGHKIVVATNQSGVGRGYYSLNMLEQIHMKMQTLLQSAGGFFSGIYFCPHKPEDHCECRKPKPGLLNAIAKDFPHEFSEAIFVGDSLRDIEAAHAANCQAALVKTGSGFYTMTRGEGLDNILIFDDLSDFADFILGRG